MTMTRRREGGYNVVRQYQHFHQWIRQVVPGLKKTDLSSSLSAGCRRIGGFGGSGGMRMPAWFGRGMRSMRAVVIWHHIAMTLITPPNQANILVPPQSAQSQAGMVTKPVIILGKKSTS